MADTGFNWEADWTVLDAAITLTQGATITDQSAEIDCDGKAAIMISIDSDGVENMNAFRSETCRIPRKPNPRGLHQIMNKQEMKRLGIDSPNLTDGSMMCLVNPVIVEIQQPLPQGRKRHRA